MAFLASFAELAVTQKSKGATRLEKIEGLVSWNRFGYRLKKILARSGLGPTGYDPLQLFKALILQNLYGLSDPVMEEMLYDRLSFRRFCGFSLSDDIPDETTLCRFRGALQGHTDKLFRLVLEELRGKGITLQSGTIIDATVIDSGVKSPYGGTVSEVDPEAGWTKKAGTYRYGYKAHVASDAKTGLIKRVIATSADVHDGQVFGQLLNEEESAVYADKAYDSHANRSVLKARGARDCVMRQSRRGTKSTPWVAIRNRLLGRTRSGIERIFAHWKTFMGLAKSRYRGWARHQVHFDLIAMAYNLRRAVSILPSTG